MELNEQLFAPTLAHRLGDVPHVSGLLRRIAQLSGAGERVADWLLKVAVALGAKHSQLRRLQTETEAELAAFTPALPAKAFRGEL